MQASSLSMYTPKPPASPLHPSPEPAVPLQVLFRQKLPTVSTRYFAAEKQLPPEWGHTWLDQQPSTASSTLRRGGTTKLGALDRSPALTKLAGDD